MRYAVLAMVGLLLLASTAQAQQLDRRGIPYRAWDVDAGVGFQSLASSDRRPGADLNQTGWDVSWAGTVDVGHYWTSHLKTSVGLTFLQSTTEWESSLVPAVPGGRGYAATVYDVNRLQVSAAGTWQFLENAFMHPYVSAGARVLVMDVSAHRDPFVDVWTSTGSSRYPIEGLDRDYMAVRVRPFAAIGSKSYFSERTFVRPELALAFNERGLGQWGARLAFGVDF